MNVFIQLVAEQLHWWQVDDDNSQFFQGDMAAFVSYYQQQEQVRNWVYLVSGLDTAIRRISFTDKERRHIRKALGFILEDDCLHDADQLHYISGKPSQNAMTVAAIEKQLLSQHLAWFEEQGIALSHCIAESLLLPAVELAEDEWQLLYYQQRFFIQLPEQAVLAIEEAHLALSLELLTAHYAELPKAIYLYADDQAQWQTAEQLIPSPLHHLLKQQLWDRPASWQQSFSQQGKQWNFLQGGFARSKEWLGQIKPWRYVLALLAITVAMYSVLLWSDYRYEKQRQVELRQELDSEFRKVFPQGQIVDHKRQLERVLNSVRGNNDQQAIIVQLEGIGQALAQHKVSVLNSLNYELDKKEIRLDLLVDSYNQLENMINDVREQGYEVEIQNSNAQGEQLRARIRIVK